MNGRVRPRPEGEHRMLALHDQSEGHALHATRGAAAGQLAPEHGRQREADEVVDGLPRLPKMEGGRWRRKAAAVVVVVVVVVSASTSSSETSTSTPRIFGSNSGAWRSFTEQPPPPSLPSSSIAGSSSDMHSPTAASMSAHSASNAEGFDEEEEEEAPSR